MQPYFVRYLQSVVKSDLICFATQFISIFGPHKDDTYKSKCHTRGQWPGDVALDSKLKWHPNRHDSNLLTLFLNGYAPKRYTQKKSGLICSKTTFWVKPKFVSPQLQLRYLALVFPAVFCSAPAADSSSCSKGVGGLRVGGLVCWLVGWSVGQLVFLREAEVTNNSPKSILTGLQKLVMIDPSSSRLTCPISWFFKGAVSPFGDMFVGGWI